MKILLRDADAGVVQVLRVLTWLMARLVAQPRDTMFMQGHRWAAVVLPATNASQCWIGYL
jgi:hypothetical protein